MEIIWMRQRWQSQILKLICDNNPTWFWVRINLNNLFTSWLFSENVIFLSIFIPKMWFEMFSEGEGIDEKNRAISEFAKKNPPKVSVELSGDWLYLPCNLILRFFIISSVMRSRSYSGFQPHSSRAQESSILLGQLSAMACLMGSGW